jgi:Na+/H+ antiporter NhaB
MTTPMKARAIRKSCIGETPLWGSHELVHMLIIGPFRFFLNPTNTANVTL